MAILVLLTCSSWAVWLTAVFCGPQLTLNERIWLSVSAISLSAATCVLGWLLTTVSSLKKGE